MTDKTSLRILAKQRILSFENKEEASARITENFLSLAEYKTAKKIAVFLSTDSEPNTSSLIGAALASGKEIFCPISLSSGEMVFTKIDTKTEFRDGLYGIREPKIGETETEFDIICVPLVAFDKGKNRLGHGKGYYDRFLKNVRAKKIGLAFSCQEFRSIRIDENDVPLDGIITEKEIKD